MADSDVRERLRCLKNTGKYVVFLPSLLEAKMRGPRTTQQLSITLSMELAETVKAKVASGEYAAESEDIRDDLRALLARDRVVDQWLREKVAPTYDVGKSQFLTSFKRQAGALQAGDGA
jgi:antitoxin ParD1/3/4